LGGTLGEDGRPLVDTERGRLRTARSKIEADLIRARDSIVRLVLRLELLDLEGSRGNLEANLASLEEELVGLLDAREEAETLDLAPRSTFGGS
jgi:hypothetical protein